MESLPQQQHVQPIQVVAPSPQVISKDQSRVEDKANKSSLSHGVIKKNMAAKPVKGVKIESGGGTPAPPTRMSQRQIKRPKMDDELIDFESSSRGSASKKPKIIPSTSSNSTGGSSSKTTLIQSNKSATGQKKVTKPKLSSAIKDLGRWRPPDDLMLISAILQTNDLAAVHLGVKFSCRFTLKEVEERWYALLYDPQISKLAVDAIRGLHPGVVTMALNNALWSQEEEGYLARIPSSDPGHLETFQRLLADYPAVFHPCRSATSLHHHWVLMGHYNLLCDQHVDVLPPGDNVVNFSDAEDFLNDLELMKPRDVKEEAIAQELILSDRQSKKEILKLEDDLPQWSELLDLPPSPSFDEGVLAILKGRVVQYIMRTHEVTLGRNSGVKQVTFDLSLEGPAFKISRHQATINMKSDGSFVIKNVGRRSLFLGGHAIVTGETGQLKDNQVLEISSFSLLILLNPKATPPSIPT